MPTFIVPVSGYERPQGKHKARRPGQLTIHFRVQARTLALAVRDGLARGAERLADAQLAWRRPYLLENT